MIRPITSLLNEAVTAMPVGRRVPFAEVIDGVPSTHEGGGQFVPVINDNQGGVSYWRANGKSSVDTIPDTACGDTIRVSIPLALVAFVRRDQCDDLQGLLSIAANQLRASMRPLRDSIRGAFGASVSGIQLGVDLARTDEIKDFAVPASLAILTLSFVVHIDASDACLDPCGTPYDLLCALIASANNARVVRCLGPERIEEICDNQPVACPLDYIVRDQDANILAQGTVADPCATPSIDIEVECAGGACDPFLLKVNSENMELVTDPCGDEREVIVDNTAAAQVGSNNGGLNWRIADTEVLRDGVPYAFVPAEGTIDVPSDCPPCDPFTATLNGVEIIDEADPCGASVALTCADLVDAVLVSGAAEDQKNGLYIASSPVNGRTSYELLPNHVIEWNGSEYILRDIFVGTDWITNNSPANPWDGVWVEFVGGAPIEATITQGTIADICPCADADWTLKATDGSVLDTGSIPSGGSEDIIAPDAIIRVNSVIYLLAESGSDKDVEVYDSTGLNLVGSLVGGQWIIADGQVQRKDSGGGDIGAPIAIPAEDSINVTCPDATVQLKDSAGNNIGSADSYLSNSSNNKTAPDGSFQRKDSAGADIGSPIAVRSNQTGVVATCPDGTVVVKNLNNTTLGSPTTKSNGSVDYVAPIPLKFVFAIDNDTTITWTVTDDEAGTYATYTQDGASGSLTYSLNGAAYAALSGTIVLAVGNTIAVKRSTYTAAGWIKWAP